MTTYVNGVVTVFCSRCGMPQPATQQPPGMFQGSPGLPDDGISVYVGGYYGGFFDNFGSNPEEYHLTLCHDCSVWLFHEIPVLTEMKSYGHDCDNARCAWNYATSPHGED